MPDNDETQRFDALLEAMLTKPPLDVRSKDELSDEDLREEGES